MASAATSRMTAPVPGVDWESPTAAPPMASTANTERSSHP